MAVKRNIDSSAEPVVEFSSDRLDVVRAWAPAVLLFIGYPLALVVPSGAGLSLRFYLTLPVFLWLSLWVIWGLLCLRWGGGNPSQPQFEDQKMSAAARMGTGVQAAFIVIVIGCFLSTFLSGRSDPWSAIRLAGMFAVPLYFATCPRRWIWKPLALIFALLWVLHAAHGLVEFAVGQEVVGVTGNRNWMAALILALLPWTWLAVRGRPEEESPSLLVRSGVVIVTVVVGLFLLWHAASRAAWLVLIFYVVVFQGIARFHGAKRWGLAAMVAAGIILMGWYNRGEIAAVVETDVRLPIWKGTLAMVADHPVAGVGPGNFRGAYPEYRLPAHLKRAVAAPVTEHPHNEALHVAAVLGIPAVVLWGLLLLPLVKRRKLTPTWQAIHFSAFLLIGHGMLDKTLFQVPTNMLALIFLGLLWRPWLRCRLQRGLAKPSLRGGFYLFGLLLVLAGLFAGGQAVSSDWFYRKAMLLRHEGKPRAAYEAFARSAALMPSRVRAQVFAGTLANRVLNNPTLALEHLAQVILQEPDFGHVNGEIGLTLGNAGKHEAAYPYFRRDAELFPFDMESQSRLLRNMLILERFEHLRGVLERLAEARQSAVIAGLGRNRARVLAGIWRTAVRTGDADTAVRTAKRLVAPLEQRDVAEPVFHKFAAETGVGDPGCDGVHGKSNFTYWNAAAAWKAHMPVRPEVSVPDAVAAFEDVRSKVTADSIRLGTPSAQRLLELWQAQPEYAFALFAAQMYPAPFTALVSGEGGRTGVLVAPEKGGLWLVLTEPAKAVEIGGHVERVPAALHEYLGTSEAGGLVIKIPVFPPAFCTQTQALADVVRGTVNARYAPVFGRSPSLQLQVWQTRLGLAADGQENDAGVDASIEVMFDPIYFELR